MLHLLYAAVGVFEFGGRFGCLSTCEKGPESLGLSDPLRNSCSFQHMGPDTETTDTGTWLDLHNVLTSTPISCSESRHVEDDLKQVQEIEREKSVGSRGPQVTDQVAAKLEHSVPLVVQASVRTPEWPEYTGSFETGDTLPMPFCLQFAPWLRTSAVPPAGAFCPLLLYYRH